MNDRIVVFYAVAHLFYRLHFSPHADYDNTSALFNGELIDVSSNNINENIIDPLIDIVPMTEPSSSSLSQSFSPIVTAPSATPPEDLLHSRPTPVSLTASTPTSVSVKTEPVIVLNSNSELESSVPSTDSHFDEHQTQLKTLKVIFVASLLQPVYYGL